MEAVAAGNLPLVDSSPTTAIKVIAGGYDAKADMEAEDAGGDIEILGKGGGWEEKTGWISIIMYISPLPLS